MQIPLLPALARPLLAAAPDGGGMNQLAFVIAAYAVFLVGTGGLLGSLSSMLGHRHHIHQQMQFQRGFAAVARLLVMR